MLSSTIAFSDSLLSPGSATLFSLALSRLYLPLRYNPYIIPLPNQSSPPYPFYLQPSLVIASLALKYWVRRITFGLIVLLEK